MLRGRMRLGFLISLVETHRSDRDKDGTGCEQEPALPVPQRRGSDGCCSPRSQMSNALAGGGWGMGLLIVQHRDGVDFDQKMGL
jgi:hypothetical protein